MPPKAPAPQTDETLIFLWTCLKNSGDYKIDYAAVAKTLNLTTGATSKRFSRLKQRLDAETGAQPGTPGKGTKRTVGESGVEGEEGGEEMESPKKKVAGAKGKGVGKKGHGKKGEAKKSAAAVKVKQEAVGSGDDDEEEEVVVQGDGDEEFED